MSVWNTCTRSGRARHQITKPPHVGGPPWGPQSSHRFPTARAGCTSVSISLCVPTRLSGSSPRSPTPSTRPWLPESLFWGPAASLLSLGPAARPAPSQCSCPSKTCYSSPLLRTPDPCLKPPLTSSSCDCSLRGFSHCPLVDSFLSCFHCLRHLHLDARQTRSLTHP